jgi:signal peptidase I
MKCSDKKCTSIQKEILEYGKLVLISVLIAWFMNSFIIANAQVQSGSMENTLETGDRYVGLRTTYAFGVPERYDIVMFYCPIEESTYYVKRVIGLPGEKVEIKDAKIYINDSTEPLDDSFIKENWVVKNTNMVFYVPQGYYFVLGDNRNNSKDSRYWADIAYSEGMAATREDAQLYSFVPKDKIIAKAEVKYWKGLSYLY